MYRSVIPGTQAEPPGHQLQAYLFSGDQPPTDASDRLFYLLELPMKSQTYQILFIR
jgi:hypothetical protein